MLFVLKNLRFVSDLDAILIVSLAKGYPGLTVCAIFIGVAFEIGFGLAMGALYISLEVKTMGRLDISIGLGGAQDGFVPGIGRFASAFW